MRVPYTVGRWVRGTNHYGRQRLFTYMLHTSDNAIWAVGARRIGKTSFLRQLEYLTARPENPLVPLFWDMQGCESPNALSQELAMSLEDERDRYAELGIDVDGFAGQDAPVILRRLSRQLGMRGKHLFLLIDEAEVLIAIARNEPAWLARLRRVLQDDIMRTVLASTKLLAQLNQITADWDTSPFLFGFNMINLWSLDPESGAALVEQRQAEETISVDPVVLEDILIHTNRHPYLIQYLCQRLYIEGAHGCPTLRPPEDEDLEPDHLLAGFFLIDFQHMTRLERRILLTVARKMVISEDEIVAALADDVPARIRMFLWGMEKLGHLRQIYGQWAVGNEYLRRWLHQEWERLANMREAAIDDASVEQLLSAGHVQEEQAFAFEVAHLESNYAALRDLEREAGHRAPPDLRGELERVGRFLDAARRDLSRVAPHLRPGR